MSNETRQVDLVGIIFDQLTWGFEPDVYLLAEAEDLDINVQEIRNKVNELYGEEDDYAELDFN